MIFDLSTDKKAALDKAVREGALIEVPMSSPSTRRRMWMRKAMIEEVYGKDKADPTHWAASDIQAFIQRFVTYKRMVIVLKTTGLAATPDFKLTNGGGGPIFEIRFDLEPELPPQLRIFGRFIATDAFIATSIDEKGLTKAGREKRIDVGKHRRDCQNLFQRYGLASVSCIPTVDKSLTNVRIDP